MNKTQFNYLMEADGASFDVQASIIYWNLFNYCCGHVFTEGCIVQIPQCRQGVAWPEIKVMHMGLLVVKILVNPLSHTKICGSGWMDSVQEAINEIQLFIFAFAIFNGHTFLSHFPLPYTLHITAISCCHLSSQTWEEEYMAIPLILTSTGLL